MESLFSAKRGLIILLLSVFVQGLFYLYTTPPWWHYDEPGHFEFAWEIAHFDHWPKQGEIDLPMRRRIAQSLLDHDWYHNYPHDQWPDLSKSDTPFIGPAPQWTPYPLYYIIVSLPLRAAGGWRPALQLRLAQLVSLLMLIATVGAAWGALGEILPKEHPLRWLAPTFLACLPGFLDIMTAVSDDAGAALAGTLLIWAALRTTRRGLTPLRFLGLIAAAAAAFWTKNTTWPLLLIVPIALLFGLPWRSRRIPWALLLGSAFLALTWLVRWGDPAFWFHQGASLPMRAQTEEAPWGTHAFRFAPREPTLTQWLPASTARHLEGKPVTIGIWLWSEKPTSVSLPKLCTHKGGCTKTRAVKIGAQPHFFAIQTTMPSGKYPRLLLPVDNKTQGEIYADGVVLVEGTLDAQTPPTLSADGKTVRWNGQTLSNAVRNPSAEHGWFYLNPVLHKYLDGKFPALIDIAFAAFLDPWGTATYQKALYTTLYRTFWGRLARNKADLLGGTPLYRFLLLFSLAGALGAFLAAWWYRKMLPWTESLLLTIGLILPWGLTILRGLGTAGNVIPWARYASAGILPTALFLVSGWYFWLKKGLPRVGITIQQDVTGLLAFFLTIGVIGWLSLLNYFYPHLRSWIFILLYLPLFLALAQAARHLKPFLEDHTTDQGSNK